MGVTSARLLCLNSPLLVEIAGNYGVRSGQSSGCDWYTNGSYSKNSKMLEPKANQMLPPLFVTLNLFWLCQPLWVLYVECIMAKKRSMIRAIFFDVGETLVDESRQWRLWADWLGVSHLTFFAAFGAVLERGEHHRRVFDYFAPNMDLEEASRNPMAAGVDYKIELQDFYPDALPCLTSLSKQGFKVGIAGNQPESAEAALRLCGVSADFIASSTGWGIEKPSLRFFERIVEETRLQPNQIAYVGDRLDNDILPANEVGLFTVFLERGPWGTLHARKPESANADLRIKSLAELPGLFQQMADVPKA
ncbi:MAG: hypothetical protein RLZZ407_2021 [Pseudomonadota bacterium]